MSNRTKEHTTIVFQDYNLSQIINHVDPGDIRPLYDRVLVRDEHDEEKRGSIFLPETHTGRDSKRIGVVVAVGLGDKWIERFDRLGKRGRADIKRKSLTTDSGRLEPEVKPGDRVLYSRERQHEFYVNGDRYSLIQEEQAILGILE